MLPPMHWCTNNTSADALVHQQCGRRNIGAPTMRPPLDQCTNNAATVRLMHQQFLLSYKVLVHQFTTRRYGADSSNGGSGRLTQPPSTRTWLRLKASYPRRVIPLVRSGSGRCYCTGPIELGSNPYLKMFSVFDLFF